MTDRTAPAWIVISVLLDVSCGLMVYATLYGIKHDAPQVLGLMSTLGATAAWRASNFCKKGV